MGRVVKRSAKKPKGTPTRLSSIQKTIDQGKDYVARVDRQLRLRKPSKNNAVPVPKKTKIVKAKNQPKKRPAPKPRAKVRKSVPALPAPVPAILSLPTSIPVPLFTTAPAPVPTVSRTGSRNLVKTSTKNSQIIEQQLHDRLTKHNANIGKLNFSLRWWDPNDLDLHVICPCGTQIYYVNKKCNKCGGQLDIDMNNLMNPSLQPVQHVYFNKPKKGLYKFFVKYFSGPKEYQGVKGGISSKYALSLHEDVNQIFRYQDNVSQKQTEMHYDYQL